MRLIIVVGWSRGSTELEIAIEGEVRPCGKAGVAVYVAVGASRTGQAGMLPRGQAIVDDAPRCVLAAEDLVVDFKVGRNRTLRALDHVDFELRTGEILGIVGESGSGKSTLGRAVAGFLNPSSGWILYGTDGGTLAPRPQRKPRGFRDVQMIFQESAMALNPRLPVWRLVGEAIRPNMSTFPTFLRGDVGELKSQVAVHLERAGLPAPLAADKRVAELSGGEKQRVAIARALAASPLAMVCDESVAALDVSIRAVVLNLFQRLSRESGIALLFISHDISVVAHLADRIAVMHHGRIVEQGTSSSVVDDPTDDYTRRLIAAVPSLERGHALPVTNQAGN